jgi:hypothetical protein
VPVAEIDKRTRQITKRTHSLVLIDGGAASSNAPPRGPFCAGRSLRKPAPRH